MCTTHSTGAPEGATETRDVGDAIDVLYRAINMGQLLFEAVQHSMKDPPVRDAFLAGISAMDDHLRDVKTILYANLGSAVEL